MKYKNIYSAIHNLGHSFTSFMNYIDDDFVVDELRNINRKGYDIEVDWKSGEFKPDQMLTTRIQKSIACWRKSLETQLSSQNVELKRIESLKFIWPSMQRKFMLAVDDRGKEYKIYVNEVK